MLPLKLAHPGDPALLGNMDDSTTPVPKPKKKPIMRVIAAVLGLAGLVGGISQMKSGFRQLKVDPEVGRLSQESDSAFSQANKFLEEAAPAFQAVLDSVDKDGLASVRAGKKAEAANAAMLYEQAAEQFRKAAQKAMDAAALKPPGNTVAFLETKAEAYRNFSAARDINRDIARMVLDETIRNDEELVPKVLEAAGRRDKLEEAAKEAVLRADKLVADSKK